METQYRFVLIDSKGNKVYELLENDKFITHFLGSSWTYRQDIYKGLEYVERWELRIYEIRDSRETLLERLPIYASKVGPYTNAEKAEKRLEEYNRR